MANCVGIPNVDEREQCYNDRLNELSTVMVDVYHRCKQGRVLDVNRLIRLLDKEIIKVNKNILKKCYNDTAINNEQLKKRAKKFYHILKKIGEFPNNEGDGGIGKIITRYNELVVMEQPEALPDVPNIEPLPDAPTNIPGSIRTGTRTRVAQALGLRKSKKGKKNNSKKNKKRKTNKKNKRKNGKKSKRK